MRECIKCKRMLEEKSFALRGKDKPRKNICHGCQYRSRNKAYKLRKNGKKQGYSISMEEYNKMLNNQNNLCAICKSLSDLVVDHDHVTGFVRGLLCAKCNTGIGMMKDSPDILRAASLYLLQDFNS